MTVLDAFLKTVDAATIAAGNSLRDANNACYDEWSDLLSFVPDASVQQEVKNRDSTWFFNRIDQAYGVGVNCDFYGVLIPDLPTGFADAGALLEHVRVNLRSFFDLSISDFGPYDDQVDKPRWESADPSKVLGAVMRFDINLWPTIGAASNLEDASVICTMYVPNQYWRLSTLRTHQDFDHPVSGIREWGVRATASGSLMYTRATDRVTGNPTGMFFEETTLDGGHDLWVSWQQRLADYVNTSPGASGAVVQEPIRNLPAWEKIKDLYRPTGTWL